ncbi:DNA polymerase III subunit gamma/tau [Paraburkholderia phenoliruptrix]|uniref:DNA polymerase III subunit gamma/tau n=1 Tax=Paraburkholderia phenoliruptrix TaxID=252970 RepID=UPI0034CD3371
MTYQVLARKWRPKDFASLVGQEHVVRALTHALDGGRLHHAYLFTGTRGVGKTTLSRIFSKALNCETGVSSTPCGVCRACREIDEGRFVDYVEMDAASNRGVDEMAALLERAVYAPVDARFKVYMIDEVHMLTNHAFNAMLKTLEEPPPHVKFILATTDPQKIPVTVLSRCLQFNLKQMPAGHIVSHLEHILGEEKVPYEAQALRLLARAADGSMRDALSLTDQAIAYSANQVNEEAVRGMLGALDQSYLIRLLDALAQGDGAAVLSVADEMALRSLSFSTALQDLASLLHRIAWAQFAPSSVLDEWPEAGDLRRFADMLSAEQVQLFYQIATIGRSELGLAPDEYAGFTMTLLRMLAFEPAPAGGASGPGRASGQAGAGGARQTGAPAVAAQPRASASSVALSSGSSAASSAVASIAAPGRAGSTHPAPVAPSMRDLQKTGSAVASEKATTAAEPTRDGAPPAAVERDGDRAAAPAAESGTGKPAAPEAGRGIEAEPVSAAPEHAPSVPSPSHGGESAAQGEGFAVSEAASAQALAPWDDAPLEPATTRAPAGAPGAAAPRHPAASNASSETAPLVAAEKSAGAASDASDAASGGTATAPDATPAAPLASIAPPAELNAPASSARINAAATAKLGAAAPAARPAAPRVVVPVPTPGAPRGAAPQPAAAGRAAGQAGQSAQPAQSTQPAPAAARNDARQTGSPVPPWDDIPPDDYMPLSTSDDGYYGPPDDNFMPVFDSGPDDVRVNAPAAAPAVDQRPLPPAVPLDPLGFTGDWPALAVDLPLKGISYQLAFNSELMALEGTTLKLNVPVPQYAETSQVAKLKAALAEKLGQNVDVVVEVGPARRTAAAHDAAMRAQRQQEAEREISADPFVQSLIREFGASIVPGSIRPITPDAGPNGASQVH